MVVLATYFFGSTSAMASAAKMVAPSTTMNALRRAFKARRNWFRSIGCAFLEQRFFDENHVVRLHHVGRLGVGLDHLAVGAGAPQLQAPLAAARRDAAAGNDGLHDGH